MNYAEIIKLLNGPISYGNMVIGSIEKDPNFNLNDNKLIQSINSAKQQGADIHQKNQDEDSSSFSHVAVNQRLDNTNTTTRLYLAPKQKNVHLLAIEFINWALHQGKKIKFKYARAHDRIDQMVIYLDSNAELQEKIEMLSYLEQTKPELFESMGKGKSWIFESGVNGVYLAPEPLYKDRMGRESSYTYAFYVALSSTKDIMEYNFGLGEGQDITQVINHPDFYNNFQKVFDEMLMRNGAFMWSNPRTGKYEILAKPTDEEGKMVLCSFSYDKKTKTLTETRGEASLEKPKTYHTFNQNQKAEFFQGYLLKGNEMLYENPIKR